MRAEDLPDCALSGATTTTSPSPTAMRVRCSMPPDWIPSSLVMSMRGRFVSIICNEDVFKTKLR